MMGKKKCGGMFMIRLSLWGPPCVPSDLSSNECHFVVPSLAAIIFSAQIVAFGCYKKEKKRLRFLLVNVSPDEI